MGVRWRGLDEYKRELHVLPSALGNDKAQITLENAHACAAAIKAAYPRISGNLAAGVSVIVREQSEQRTRVQVVNTSEYAWAFEMGRQEGRGRDGRWRGTTPPRPTFIPIRERYQRTYVDDLKEILRQRGMKVTGNAAA